MNFEQLFNDLKEEITAEAKEKFGEQGKDIIADMEEYLTHSKETVSYTHLTLPTTPYV